MIKITPHVFFATCIFGLVMLLTIPETVHAQSVLWSKTIKKTFEGRAQQSGGEGRWTLINPTIYVQYNTRVVNVNSGRVIACGSSVPEGTRVRFEILAHASRDIGWFATGGIYDSPYGSWSESVSKSGSICQDRNVYFRVNLGPNFGGIVDYYSDFAVKPPVKTITGLPADQCSGSGTSMTCNTTTPGVLNATYTFAPTYGRFWGGYGFQKKCVSLSNGGYFRPDRVDIDARSLTCGVRVTPALPPAQGPSAPVVTGNACVTGAATTYTVVAQHPDTNPANRRVRYQMDWDGNGSVDQVVPGSGYVAAGVAQTVTRVWATPGAKTFKVRAEDAGGRLSGWTSHTVPGCDPTDLPGDPTGTGTVTPDQLASTTPTVVTPTPPVDPATVWAYPPGTGPAGTITASVNPRLTNTTCKLSWTTENVTECKVYLQTQFVADVFVAGERDVEPGTYTVRCRQLRDNQIIQSTPQICVWNPGVREI